MQFNVAARRGDNQRCVVAVRLSSYKYDVRNSESVRALFMSIEGKKEAPSGFPRGTPLPFRVGARRYCRDI